MAHPAITHHGQVAGYPGLHLATVLLYGFFAAPSPTASPGRGTQKSLPVLLSLSISACPVQVALPWVDSWADEKVDMECE